MVVNCEIPAGGISDIRCIPASKNQVIDVFELDIVIVVILNLSDDFQNLGEELGRVPHQDFGNRRTGSR